MFQWCYRPRRARLLYLFCFCGFDANTISIQTENNFCNFFFRCFSFHPTFEKKNKNEKKKSKVATGSLFATNLVACATQTKFEEREQNEHSSYSLNKIEIDDEKKKRKEKNPNRSNILVAL